MAEDLRQLLEKKLLVLDGAMGTMIQRHRLRENDFRGERFANHPCDLQGNNDLLCLTRPDIVTDIHRQYIEAGADIISTNSFNANAISQADYASSHLVGEINRAAASLARAAADSYMKDHPGRSIYVAASIGPTNRTASISPSMDDPAYRNVNFDMLADAYAEQIEALAEGGCDILLFETVFDTLNLKAGLTAAERVAEQSGRHIPVMVSATIAGPSGRILSGQTLAALVTSISHYDDVISIGLNCSWGASEMRPYIAELSSLTDRFVSCHPNAGLPDENGHYSETPESFAMSVEKFIDDGSVNIVGGCCGTTPDHIRALREICVSHASHRPKTADTLLRLAGLDSMTVSRQLNFVNIGERCNVAGSRKFLRLISEKKYDEALAIARRQVEDGAQIIDINMDDAMLDAEKEMCHFLNLIASDPDTARVPVMIDSSQWSVLKSALKCVQGRSVVNSISLKEGVDIFISKARHISRMGAAIVVMAFDEEGQADTFERKREICRRAYDLLTREAGVKPCDIIFDPNIMAVATGIENHDFYARDFIRATRWIKENLPGAKVSGGVSNLSFAFRGHNRLREAIHAVFLYHAIAAGLDMAIVNPATNISYDQIEPDLRDIIEDLVLNGSHEAAEALARYAAEIHEGVQPEPNASTDKKSNTPAERLTEAIIRGLSDNLKADLEETAEAYPHAIDIIEGPLMEGVNRVGTLFGEGKMFLPQVVKTARVMKQAVDILKPRIEAEKAGSNSGPAGKILFATVKGDVHDIGKNIVSIVLECNNYEVIDLGVMVPAEEIVSRAQREHPDLICLSGLITPSLGEMINVADKLEAAGLDIPLIVGGATTSRLHTALRIAPHLSAPVIHATDASQNPIIAARLLDKNSKAAYIDELEREYSELRSDHVKDTSDLLSLAEARAHKYKPDRNPDSDKLPANLGTKIVEATDLMEISGLINWRMFFNFWKICGPFVDDFPYDRCEHCTTQWLARHSSDPKATEALRLYDDARSMLSAAAEEKAITVKAAVGVFPAWSDDCDNIIVGGVCFPMLRRQQPNKDGICLSASDFVRSKNEGTDYAGAFAVTVSADRLIEKFESEGDRYSLLLLRSLLDRLAEASSEFFHRYVRREYWEYAPDENVTTAGLLSGSYRGIRPAMGYPMTPDQQLNHRIAELLPFDRIGVTLTENGAMSPVSTVSGLYLSHPDSRYFMVGKIGRDQIEDYAHRRGLTTDEVERLLNKNI